MRLSIVIPIYKSYDLLPRALKSISIPPKTKLCVRIVLVDDTPGPVAQRSSVLEGICDMFPLLNFDCVFNVKNRGVTFSRNRATVEVKSDYYMFLDSDDSLEASALQTIEHVISETPRDCGVFLFRTNKNNNLKMEIGGSKLLLDDYGSGERLVVVKSGRNLPFYGALRGHELIGLLRYCDSNDFKVMTNPCILRKYNNDNTHSISAGRELFQRLPLLLKGHLKVVRYCYNNTLYMYMFRFVARSIYIWLKMKIYI